MKSSNKLNSIPAYSFVLLPGHNYSIDDISSDLLLRIHATDAWISRVLETLHGADSFLSTSCIETLHQFVSNPDRNQLLLKNLLDQRYASIVLLPSVRVLCLYACNVTNYIAINA